MVSRCLMKSCYSSPYHAHYCFPWLHPLRAGEAPPRYCGRDFCLPDEGASSLYNNTTAKWLEPHPQAKNLIILQIIIIIPVFFFPGGLLSLTPLDNTVTTRVRVWEALPSNHCHTIVSKLIGRLLLASSPGSLIVLTAYPTRFPRSF